MTDFDAAYRAHADTVYRYLFSLTLNADLSEELTQQTFYEAIRCAGRYRGDAAFSTWLCAIAKRLLWQERRRASRSPLPLEAAEALAAPTDVASAWMDTEAYRALWRRIRALPPLQREVMCLRLSGELSFREIGEILSRSETWARVNFYRAKQALSKGEDV